jgi:tetratricopeptide (TPR) repeat protein
MASFLPCIWFGLLCLGQEPASAEPGAAAPPALRAWQEGQQALVDGRADDAIRRFQDSLRLDPHLARNHLSLASAYLAQGRDEQAAPHLASYLDAQPDHLVVRAHYADLLLRLARPRDAREQFQRFVADVQDHDALARQHLVHCHSKLMEIAEAEEDAYGEHLHRGIGLYHLACRRAELHEDGGPLTVEGLLCKAAAELTVARMERPEQARPYWYLYEVWTRLGQQHPATRCLRTAEATATLSYLTPAEQRALFLACRQADREAQRK